MDKFKVEIRKYLEELDLPKEVLIDLYLGELAYDYRLFKKDILSIIKTDIEYFKEIYEERELDKQLEIANDKYHESLKEKSSFITRMKNKYGKMVTIANLSKEELEEFKMHIENVYKNLIKREQAEAKQEKFYVERNAK